MHNNPCTYNSLVGKIHTSLINIIFCSHFNVPIVTVSLSENSLQTVHFLLLKVFFFSSSAGMIGADVKGFNLPCEDQPITSRLAMICGTSTCHMAVSKTICESLLAINKKKLR